MLAFTTLLIATVAGLLAVAPPTVTTVAGTGEAGYSPTQMSNAYGVVMGPDGTLLICDVGNHRIRRLHLGTGIIQTFAGTGEAAPTTDGALCPERR